MLYCACAPVLCHLCPLYHHDIGGGGGRWHGMLCNGSCTGVIGTCVVCVTCATMTWRRGGGGGGASESVPRHVP